MGSTWGQPGVNLWSIWGQPGVNLGSAWGQPGVILHRPTGFIRLETCEELLWCDSGTRFWGEGPGCRAGQMMLAT